ncbi:MAG: type I methionyl aminopeptidase [Nitrospirae bacterium RIFCSPHIGHO2_01_FULL_66_17]|nr:MAG: type I methionyl aminopeptidase [Nitrospirae bacterium RIFCSPHIGHO2_01_FULL_66_17]
MIILKTPQEIAVIERASRVVALAIAFLREQVKPGVTTADLDRLAEEFITREGAIPAFKGYRGYPATLCTSVNEEVVHGIPSSRRRLEEGDIIGIDVGAIVEGFYGDAAVTLPVGRVSEEAARLLRVTEAALDAGLAQVRAGNRLSDISHAVQTVAEDAGYSVVTDFVGHGIGRNLHEDPQVPNFGKPGEGPRLKEGLVLAIEPMVNIGGHEVEVLSDRWTVVTRDKSLSAHFEHTIAITPDGPKVLTRAA